MTTLPQQNTIDQYVADGVATDFIFSYLIPTDADIAVYETPQGDVANPTDDIQALNVDYTVSGAGNVSGGIVSFVVPPVLGTTVTLSRNIQFSISTNFASAQTISGVNLDNAFQRVTLMAQQLNSFYEFRGLQYIINSYIPESTTPTLMPLLGEGQSWQGTAGGTVIAVTIEEDPDVSTLRSELASQVQNADGAKLIGYYDEENNVGLTLDSFLNGLPAYIAAVVSGLVPTSGFQTGDVKPTLNLTPLTGWILWQDGTIGDVASGGSIRANADTQPLFEMLWNGFGNAQCAVSGGRGANATADFIANKTIALPIVNGRTLVNLHSTYLPGETFGEVSSSIAIANMPAHSHSGSIVTITTYEADDSQPTPKVGSGNGDGTSAVNVALNIASEGGGTAFENRQPSVACYYNIKL